MSYESFPDMFYAATGVHVEFAVTWAVPVAKAFRTTILPSFVALTVLRTTKRNNARFGHHTILRYYLG